MNKCTLCSRMYEYKRSAGHTKKVCNSCMVNRRRFKIKEKAVDYKGGCCEECGYSKCLQALDFHHLDQTKKDFVISGAHARSWQAIKEELDKCRLLCANCHREVHANEK